jgi:GNAT superfamily N-acetyltransferase
MKTEGYRLVVAESDGQLHAVAGFRVIEMLRTGKSLEVDDLITDEYARSLGLGHQLMAWLRDEAKREHCNTLELDSAVTRTDAHRFYYRERMHILAYHFSITLPADPTREPVPATSAAPPPNS